MRGNRLLYDAISSPAACTLNPSMRLGEQMKEAHELLAGILRNGQKLGGIAPDRDAEAEAWIFLGIGTVVTFARRVGDVMKDEDLAKIVSSRSRWLTGRS